MKYIIVFVLLFQLLFNYIQSTTLPSQYSILGPFPIGEHEEIFDTLESYGGIFNIVVGDNSTYPSELGKNSVVGWSYLNSTVGQEGSIQTDWSSTISFESFYDMPFGWNVYLWYAYAIGQFSVTESSNYIVNCTNLRTYYIQSLSNPSEIYEFSGDFFAYGNAQQLLYLNQGESYRIILRMVSSTRVYGSAFSQVHCSLVAAQDQITFIPTQYLISDVVDGILATPYASITLLNSGSTDFKNGITIALQDGTQSDQLFNLNPLINDLNLTKVLVGQRFSIPFELSVKDNSTLLSCPFNLEISVSIIDDYQQLSTFNTVIPLNCTDFEHVFLYTFLDFDQTVQYAMALAPLSHCGLDSNKCMIQVALHGFLGVTSDPSWTNNFNRQSNLWILMPTGRTNCGYDWASSSRLNVYNSIQSLAKLLPGVSNQNKSLYETDPSKLLIIGHSMGGMGCWNLLVRYGDLAIGGACASGFSKLSQYISYELSPGFSYIDQSLKSLLMISIEENNVDIISSNLVGLPLMAIYGENDTVVSPYHSRRIVRMVSEQSQDENAVVVVEIPGANHWADNMLSDSVMQSYYESLMSKYSTFLPPIPKTITISTLNPSSTSSRANVLILQLSTPYKLAKIKLTQVYNSNNQLVWYLETSNVRRFAITPEPVRQEFPDILIIDGKQQFNNQYFYPQSHYENKQPSKLSNQKQWVVNQDNQDWTQFEKNPQTYGPIRTIFEKNFKIIYGTASGNNQTTEQFKKASVYINNFWNNYGRGSVSILSDLEYIEQLQINDTLCSENLILIGSSNENYLTDKNINSVPISFNSDNSFTIGGKDAYLFNSPGIGIVSLVPSKCGQNVYLIVAGTDSLGLDNAIHSIPQRSGDITGTDFIVTGPDFNSKGYGGILSAGYWDNFYQIDSFNFYFSDSF